MALAFPDVSPVLLTVGPIKIHWYGVAYIVGIVAAGYWGNRLLRKFPFAISPKVFDDFFPYAIAGIIIGGRLGHVFFYEPSRYLANPLEIFMVWKGGMSFHGGLLGVIFMAVYYAKSRKINFYEFCDLLALITPIGLFFGRIANFVNAELFGVVTSKPWGVIFPGQTIPRHPTQLYEAALEGALSFVALNALYARSEYVRSRKGVTACLFLGLYAIFRLLVETFKIQDALVNVGGVKLGTGVILCALMLLTSVYLMRVRLRAYADSSRKTAP